MRVIALYHLLVEKNKATRCRPMHRAIIALLLRCSYAGIAIGGGHGSSGHASSSPGSHDVSPHATKNGTFVEGHYQSNPNASKSDNWSTQGNNNPYTGKAGNKSESVESQGTTGSTFSDGTSRSMQLDIRSAHTPDDVST